MAKRRPTYLQDRGPSVSAPTNLEDPPGVQPITTKATKLDPEGEGKGTLGDMGNLVDLEAMMADVKVVEVFKPRSGDEGGPRFHFLSTERKVSGRNGRFGGELT
jgi:hypothetical protein